MNRSNVLWGGVLIVMGVLFMLDNLNVLDFGETIRTWWPLLFIALGIQLMIGKKGNEQKEVR